MANAERKPVLDFSDLRQRCLAGDLQAQALCIDTLKNLGAEHLAPRRNGNPPWESAFRGLQSYVMSLVGEYGINEDQATTDVITELNFLLDWRQ